MDQQSPAIAGMMDIARNAAGFSISAVDLARLERHDPSDPFSRTAISKEVFNTRYWMNFSANCITTAGQQRWIDEKGEKIETPRPLTISWSREMGQRLADDLTRNGWEAVLSTGGTDPVEKERLKVVVPIHHMSDRNRYPGHIDVHYLIIHAYIRNTSGTRSVRTFRTDSIGRHDAARKIIERIRAIDNAMPADPDQALEEGRRHAERVMRESFASHGIEPRITDIRKANGDDLTFDIWHTMTNTLMQEYGTRDQVRFHGGDPDDPWKASISSFGSGMRDGDISAEAKRRAQIEKNGGLLQTSLVRQLVESRGLKPVPLSSDHGGGTKSEVFHLPTDPPTKVRMFVKDGRLEAEVHIGKDMRITTGSISIDNIDVPEVSVRGLKGKPLRALIDHPLVADDMVITSITPKGLGIRARIRMGSHRVDTSEIDEG